MFSERIEGTRIKEIRLYQVIAIEASFKNKEKGTSVVRAATKLSTARK